MQTEDIFLHDFRPEMARAADPDVFSRQLHAGRADSIETACAMGTLRHDAVDSLLSARDLEQVLSEVMRDSFGPRYSSQYIPVGPFGVDAWADRFIQKRISRSGLIDYVSSAHMSQGNLAMTETSRKLYTLGGKAELSWFEMQSANRASVNLMGEMLMERREAAEDTKDLILISGDSALPSAGGFIPTGLINDPDIPVATAGTGDWDGGSATAAQVIADVQGMYVTYRSQSRRTERADTLLLPEGPYAFIESTQVPNTSMTIRSWLIANIPELQTIDVLPELAGAGAAGVDRAILYAKSDRVLRGILPLDFSFIAEEFSKLRTYIWGVLRMVGLVVLRPFGMLYVDNV